MQQQSAAERQYIVAGAAAGVRADGRSPLERRPVSLETGLLPSASGSARARVGGVTDVLVGVTATIGEPSLLHPNEGVVDISVECSSLASPDFTGRGADELNAELAMMLSRLYTAEAAGPLRRDLCLIPARKCWVLQIDTLVLDSGGSVCDAASLAVRAALRTTLLPTVRVIPGEADEDDDVEVDEGILSPLLSASLAPVAVTLTFLGDERVSAHGRKREHDSYVADATSAEMACASMVVTVGVDASGKACGTVAAGDGGIALDALPHIFRNAQYLGVDAIKAVDSFVDDILQRRNNGEAVEPVGFFA